MLRLAFRSIARGRWATVIQLATIAVGVGGLSAVVAVVGAVILRPLPFNSPGELITIDVTSARGFSISTSIPNFRDWRDRNRTLAAYGGIAGWNFRLTRSGETQILDGAAVYGDLSGVLRLRPELGRVIEEKETEPGSPALAMLGHSTWQAHFAGDTAIVGSTVTLDGVPHRRRGAYAGLCVPEDGTCRDRQHGCHRGAAVA